MNDLQIYSPPNKDEFESLMRMATAGSNSGLLPEKMTANQAVVIFLAGRECGWSPFVSLRRIDVVKGRAFVKPEGLLALAWRNIPGFEFEIIEQDHAKCHARARRNEKSAWIEAKFTIEDAQRAGLAGGENWKKYPADMLFRRCVGRLMARVAPDGADGPLPPWSEEFDTPEPPPPPPPDMAEALAPATVPIQDEVRAIAAEEEKWKADFLSLAASLGHKVAGKGSAAVVLGLLQGLGVPHGRDSKSMLPGTWKLAHEKLLERQKRSEAVSSAEVVEDAPAASAPKASAPVADAAPPPQAPVGSVTIGDEEMPADYDDDNPIPLVAQVDAMLRECARLEKGRGNAGRPFVKEGMNRQTGEYTGQWYLTDSAMLKAIGYPAVLKDGKEVYMPVKLDAMDEPTLRGLLGVAEAEAARLGGRR